MRRKRITLTVIPERGGKAYTVGFTHAVLFSILALLFVSLLVLAALVKSGVEKAVSASAVKMQSEENRIIAQKLEDFNSELGAIAGRVETLKAMGEHVRELSNMEHIPQGASLAKEEGENEWRDKSEDVVSAKLDMLLRETRDAREGFEQLLESLAGQEYLLSRTPSIRPASGWLISGYGYTKSPFTGRTEMHMGVDIAALEGTPICATADGRVSFVGHKPGYGLTVVVDHGSDVSTWYGHCSKAKVMTGEAVKRGTIIAAIGKTGQAIGPHVQYEVRVKGEPVNPADFFLDGGEPEL
jgi:murein DD-endopeptidase MepM/ murein hydrolase activator NlpD